MQQKSKSKSKESQLPLKSEGSNEGKGFRGNCDSQGKLGMCPSLAEPDWGGFPKRIVFSYKPQANKSFSVQQFFKNAAEVWASSPHLRSKLYFAICFPLLQLHFLKLINSQVDCLCETSCKFGQGNGAIAACWQAKAGVEPPFAGRERPVSLREVLS